MPWYEDGDWEGLRTDRRGHLLAQMMYAVNEREALVGRPLTTWGVLGVSYPQAFRLDPYTIEYGDEFLELLQQSIPSLYDTAQAQRFVKPDGTDWSAAALFAAAGTADHWLSLGRPSGLAPFLQLKAVLDQLVYTLTTANLTNRFTRNKHGNPFNHSGASLQAAWDAALADSSPLTNQLLTAYIGHGDTEDEDDLEYWAQIVEYEDSCARLPFIPTEAPVAIYVRLFEVLAGTPPFALGPIDIDIGGWVHTSAATYAENNRNFYQTVTQNLVFGTQSGFGYVGVRSRLILPSTPPGSPSNAWSHRDFTVIPLTASFRIHHNSFTYG